MSKLVIKMRENVKVPKGNCIYELIDADTGEWKCVNCDDVYHNASRMTDRRCDKFYPVDHTRKPFDMMEAFACTSRGEVVGVVECPSCCGVTKFKVFGCLVHGRCVISSKELNIQSCLNCEERTP